MSLSPIYPQNCPFIGTYPRLYPQTYPQGLLHPEPLEIQYLLCKGRTFGTYSSVAIKLTSAHKSGEPCLGDRYQGAKRPCRGLGQASLGGLYSPETFSLLGFASAGGKL